MPTTKPKPVTKAYAKKKTPKDPFDYVPKGVFLEEQDIVLKCPYCGEKWRERGEPGTRWQGKFIVCDSSRGGCGGEFIIKYQLLVNTTSYKITSGDTAYHFEYLG